ncbi:hypothetical protein SANA_24750 [Gottschalkiaceae bacterium SANA]|nr:hypothetical protein SANA_24750 [Gottschalkiaceae bacterium SANA]
MKNREVLHFLKFQTGRPYERFNYCKLLIYLLLILVLNGVYKMLDQLEPIGTNGDLIYHGLDIIISIISLVVGSIASAIIFFLMIEIVKRRRLLGQYEGINNIMKDNLNIIFGKLKDISGFEEFGLSTGNQDDDFENKKNLLISRIVKANESRVINQISQGIPEDSSTIITNPKEEFSFDEAMKYENFNFYNGSRGRFREIKHLWNSLEHYYKEVTNSKDDEEIETFTWWYSNDLVKLSKSLCYLILDMERIIKDLRGWSKVNFKLVFRFFRLSSLLDFDNELWFDDDNSRKNFSER